MTTLRKIGIVFIVNGENVSIDVDPLQPLSIARDAALTKSHHRLENRWELRDEAGRFLSSDNTAAVYGFVNGTRVFLTLEVGAGACCERCHFVHTLEP